MYGGNMPESNVKTFDVRRVKKTPAKELNRSNFWYDKPTEAPARQSYSYLAYILICLVAFSIAALTTILINVSRSTPQTNQAANALSSQTYQPQSKPGEKDPFTGDGLTQPSTPPSTAPDQLNQAKPPAIDKKAIRLRVLNGSGITGDAAKTKTDLETKGYVISSIGNAKFNYTQTQIYYLSGKNQEADLVAQDLTDKEAKKSEAVASVVGDNTDVLVVVGKRWMV